jgi:carboxylesterase type B
VRFAATGDPNGGGMATWPLFTITKEDYLEFGDDAVRAGTSFRKPFTDLYQQLLAPYLAEGR